MDKKIVTIDVSNIPPHIVESYMNEMIDRMKTGKSLSEPYNPTKWQRFKMWCSSWIII